MFLIVLTPIYIFSQSNEWELNCSMRIGVSNFWDEINDDAFKYKVSSLLGLNIQKYKKNIGFRGSVYYMLNGAYNIKTRKDIHISNFGISQNLLFASKRKLSVVSIGLYESFLMNRVFPSEYNGHPYEFNAYDIGFVLVFSQKIFLLCKKTAYLEFNFSSSINSVYNNQKNILTDGSSKWTRNVGLLIGVNLPIN